MNLKHVQGSVTEHVGTFGFPCFSRYKLARLEVMCCEGYCGLSSLQAGRGHNSWKCHHDLDTNQNAQKIVVGQRSYFSTKKNANSVSSWVWIQDLILIGIYGHIDVDVLFRNVSKTSGDVENSGDGMDGMEVWKIRRMPMSLAPWGNLRVGPFRWRNVTTGSFQKRHQKHIDCLTCNLRIIHDF